MKKFFFQSVSLYQALKKIREAKSINLESETQEEFGDAEGIIEIL